MDANKTAGRYINIAGVTSTASTPKYRIVKTGRTWSIIDSNTHDVVEGGFFDQDFALTCLAEWNARIVEK